MIRDTEIYIISESEYPTTGLLNYLMDKNKNKSKP